MSTVGRNSLYNLAGSGIPLVLFLLTIPVYIWLIGPERYGVMAIVWLVVGFFGLMDMGLGRAVTQQIAVLRDADGQDRRIVLGTAMVSNLAIGALGALLMLFAAYLTFGYGLKLSSELREEALMIVPLMALGVPVVTTYSVLAGALQGREQFGKVARVAITNSTLFQCLPIVVALIVGPHLVPLVASAVAARCIAVTMLWRECVKEFGPGFMSDWQRERLLQLLSFGGWVTLSGVIGTILVFSDRLLIGASIGAVAVTIYAVPLDASRRLAVISDSLANALFPRLATADRAHSRDMTKRAVEILYVITTPGVAVIIVVADPLMRIWLGEDIGSQSAPLLQILAIAAWSNIFAKPSYAKLQAQGRPKTVAILSLSQVPVYLTALWFALEHFGLAGAAWVYVARNTVDFVMLSVAADRAVERGFLLAATFTIFVAVTIALQSIEPMGLSNGAFAGLATGAIATVLAGLTIPAELRGRMFHFVRTGIGLKL